MKSSLNTLFLLLLALFVPFGVNAQEAILAPKVINYQGKLTDAADAPLGGETGGTFRLRFEIFPQPTDDTGVWAEERDVVVIGGIFNVALGGAGGNAVGATPHDLAVAFGGPDRFLETTIVSGPGIAAEQTLAPRQQLVSTPYALVSQTTERAAVATLAESLIPELMKALNPPGTIIAYAGPVSDNGGLVEPVPGYLLCNGAVFDAGVDEGKYSALAGAVGGAWGNGADSNAETFNVPDLRGVFLRGWNGAAGDGFSDPDRNGRVARKAGGSTGNSVGAFQMDIFKDHTHQYLDRWQGDDQSDNANDRTVASYLETEEWRTTAGANGGLGGSETRGKNAYVVYLIKY